MQTAVDLLITDFRMPEMDGRVPRPRAARPRPGVTGALRFGLPGRAVGLARTEHFLAKPFSRYELLGTVRKVLDAPALISRGCRAFSNPLRSGAYCCRSDRRRPEAMTDSLVA